ncbi:MAG: NYN domain-containing protein [Planctomycetota bacterium]
MLLVDTSNVLMVPLVLPEHVADLDVPTLARLIAASRYRSRAAVLVCDGAAPRRAFTAETPEPAGTEAATTNIAPTGREVAGLDVVYSGSQREADDVIELLIDRDTAPRRLTVVSNDRRLVRAARKRRARSLASDSFLRHLVRDSERRGPAPIPGFAQEVPLRQYAVDYWMTLFGYAPIADDGERATDGSGVADISLAALRGAPRPKPKSSVAGERLRIPRPAPRSPEASPEPQLDEPAPDPSVSSTQEQDEPSVPDELRDIVRDSGLDIDPADLDMQRWMPKRDGGDSDS